MFIFVKIPHFIYLHLIIPDQSLGCILLSPFIHVQINTYTYSNSQLCLGNAYFEHAMQLSCDLPS